MNNMKIKFIWLGLFAVMLFAGCTQPVKTGGTAKTEMEQTETNHVALAKADPPPTFKESQERKNLIRRLSTWNVPNKLSYITLFTQYGQLIRYDVVKGKVSSVNSMLTNPEQVLDDPHGSVEAGSVVVPSPDFDGSYGENGSAIFYFTPTGEYVEWNGPYILTDRPQNIRVEPLTVVDATKQYIKASK
jgi:hypothetical protein